MKQKILFFITLPLILLSCARENLPTDLVEPEQYGSLYLESNQGNAVFGISYDLVPTDTVIRSYTVNLGGGFVSKTDVPVSFAVAPDLVATYNTGRMASMRATLLPEGSYTLQTEAVLKAGTTHTDLIPVTIDVSKLNPNGNYVLPLQLSADNTAYPLDSSRRTAYLAFNVAPSTKGVWIGNIPALVDDLLTSTSANNTRPMVTDFFGDILVKDRLGNLIIYPLESNSDTNRLGPPDTLMKPATNNVFARSNFVFFNDHMNSLMVTPFTGANNTNMLRFPATPRQRDVKGSATLGAQVIHATNANYKLYYTWYMGYDNWMYFCTAGGAGRLYYVNPATPNVFTQISPGINETIYQFWTCVDEAHVVNHSDGLRILGALPVYTSLNNHTITSGKNFFTTYAKFASIKKRDLVGVRKNGDIILWKRFNRLLWYDGNDIIRPAE